MKNTTDRGRSVHFCGAAVKSITVGLSLLLACAATGTSFLVSEKVKAEEDRKPLAAVAVSAEPLAATAVAAVPAENAVPLTAVSVVKQAEPLMASPVEQKEAVPLTATSLIPEVKIPDSYVNDYLGFTRTDLVSYLVEHADAYLGTPYKEETVAPVLGKSGHMQCEGFIWDVMLAVSTQHENDVPCGNILTEPANGGGWVNWSYYHDVDPITFNTKEEMLASGILEKGDVIWSFDYAGPYGLSNSNHVGFFWGDDPHDDKFWESAVDTGKAFYAGSADGNRIAGIESMSAYPSVWWVFKMSPDSGYDPQAWAGLPTAGITDTAETSEEKDTSEETDTEEVKEVNSTGETAADNASKEDGMTEDSGSAGKEETVQDMVNAESETDDAEFILETETDTGYTGEPVEEEPVYSDTISTSYTSQGAGGMVFYNGDSEDTGYYNSFGAGSDSDYYYGY